MSEHDQGPILVAVDFSADSEAAFVWATRTAARFGVPLCVVHVVHDPAAAPGYYSKTDASGGIVRMEEVAREMFEAFIAKMRVHPRAEQSVELTSRVTSGLPATRILELATEEKAQLIVVGSRGRTRLESLLIGSKATRVAQLSTVPVTIVKHSYIEA